MRHAVFSPTRSLRTDLRHKHAEQEAAAGGQRQDGEVRGEGAAVPRPSGPVPMVAAGAVHAGSDWPLLLGGGVRRAGLRLSRLPEHPEERRPRAL